MIGSFSFNGIEAESFNLVCRSVKRPLLPAAKIKRVELAGTSGAYDFDGKEYTIRQVTMRVTYLGKNFQELRTRARRIAAWLGVNVWAKLIINDEPDKYYLAKITDEIELESLWESGTLDITFDCQPFAMSVNETHISFPVIGSENKNFINEGTQLISFKSPEQSKSLITVDGSWSSLSVAMNGNTLQYNLSGEGRLVIDNINMDVKMNGINIFGSITGDIDSFFTILPGDNSLIITGSTVNANVTINYISLWL